MSKLIDLIREQRQSRQVDVDDLPVCIFVVMAPAPSIGDPPIFGGEACAWVGDTMLEKRSDETLDAFEARAAAATKAWKLSSRGAL